MNTQYSTMIKAIVTQLNSMSQSIKSIRELNQSINKSLGLFANAI